MASNRGPELRRTMYKRIYERLEKAVPTYGVDDTMDYLIGVSRNLTLGFGWKCIDSRKLSFMEKLFRFMR